MQAFESGISILFRWIFFAFFMRGWGDLSFISEGGADYKVVHVRTTKLVKFFSKNGCFDRFADGFYEW